MTTELRPRTLSVRELNRATLARQMLLERRRVPLVQAVERVAGMQAQWARSPYVGLWSRLSDFDRSALERAFHRGRVIRAVLMRGTIHLVSARDYALFRSALDIGVVRWIDGAGDAIARRLANEVRAFARQPRTRDEVFTWLMREHGLEPDSPRGLWYALRVLGSVAHAPAMGVWKAPPVTTFVTVDCEALDAGRARVELVRRYLAAFGPASRADIAAWAGTRVTDLVPALEALEPLRRFRDEEGRDILDLPRAPLPAAETRAPARFLPKWDSVLLAHADRRRVLPEEYRKTVIGPNGDVAQTFLVDGVVAGRWSLERGRVRLEPFAPLPRSVSRELEEEAARLEAFVR